MPIYRFETFELDVDLYRLSHSGNPVAIGPKVFDLLSYLLRNSHRAISKQELVREVWLAEAVSNSSVPTCITALRRALGDDPQNPRFVETVRGRGYRFIGKVICDSEAPSNSDTSSLAKRGSKPFVGRTAEMASLLTGLSQALAGDPQVFLVFGEAGIGKTRMIEEFSRLAEAQGAIVLVGRCREEEGSPPFWPWIQILRTLIESTDRRMLPTLRPFAPVISQMLPDLRNIFPAIDSPRGVNAEQARFRLLDAVTRFLRAASQKTPIVLMIDDLHRSDTSSLLLLEFFARELRASPILTIAAYRDLDLQGDINREHCLTRVARNAVSRSIQLRGISRRAVSELIGQPESAHLVDVLYEQSGGNPFFLTQLVHLHELDPTALSSHPSLDRRLSIPAGVRDTICDQLNGLPFETRAALTIAAVIGREFSPTVLARVSGAPLPRLLEQLEPAVAARVIEVSQQCFGAYRFCHALLRDVAYSQISTVQRSQLHIQIGDALEALHASDLDSRLAELAYHFCEGAPAGDTAKALSYCVAAGEQAAARLAHENAPPFFRMALRVMDIADLVDPRKRCELLIQLGAAEMRAGERQSAREDLIHAAKIARQIHAPELLANAALGLAPGFFTIEVGTYDPELESLLTEAKISIPKNQTDLLIKLTARLAMAAVWSTRAENCDQLSATAIDLARNVPNLTTKAYALRARHGALWGPKRFDERRKLISELRDVSAAAGDIEITFMYLILHITALLEAGDIAEVDREIRTYAELAKALQLPHAEWYVSLFTAMRALMSGNYSGAAVSAKRFLEIGNRVEDENAAQSFAAHLLLRLWEDNQLNEISSFVEAFIVRHPMIVAWKAAAAFIYSEDRNPEGSRLFNKFCDVGFGNLPLNETWSIAVQMFSNTCVNLGRVSDADHLYALMLPGESHFTIVGYGVMSWGSRARELGNLAGLMERFDEAAEHFELAIAQNRRTGQAPWVARSQYDYARMLARRRDRARRGQIRELVTEAQTTANQLGMVRLKLQIADLAREI